MCLGDGPWMAMESIDVSHVCRFLDCEMDVTHCESSFIRWGAMIVFSATKARLIVFVCFNLCCRQTFFWWGTRTTLERRNCTSMKQGPSPCGRFCEWFKRLCWSLTPAAVCFFVLRSPVKLVLEFLHHGLVHGVDVSPLLTCNSWEHVFLGTCEF